MANSVLVVNNLKKVFGDIIAVDDVSFAVDGGEIVGLLGPNGAGKTTTINMILGTLAPTAGSVSVKGMNIAEHRSQVLKRMNFAAVYAPLPGNLTIYQNLHIFGLLYGVKNMKERIEMLINRFDLQKFRDKKSGVLSSGEQTRLSLAKAMLNDPDLLLLDEPTASLDPSVAREIRSIIREFITNLGCAVLWTSHNMNEVETVCDRVLFLSHGKIILQGDPKVLPQQYCKANLEELFIMVANKLPACEKD
ncbi:MAG: ABC transporter ATP-binding protein [Candidatus Omnitrophica bacterium]|nr:ABC transporter ATP-binding protein [Candidatus Omnitrophota bacterium]